MNGTKSLVQSEEAPVAVLQALFDSAPVAIYHVDRGGHLTYANPQYRAIFALHPNQSLDEWELAMHPDDRERIKARWQSFFTEQAACILLEYRAKASEHQWRFFREYVVVIADPGIGGFVGTITDVTDLRSALTELDQSREMFKLMAESTQAVPFTLDLARDCFTYIGTPLTVTSGIPEPVWSMPGALEIVFPRELNQEVRRAFDQCKPGAFEFLAPLTTGTQHRREVRWMGTCEAEQGGRTLRGLMLDVTEVRRLGRELAAAQKLESIGRLAAGVAHEINTPVQFVTDNTQFVRSAIVDLLGVIEAYRQLKTSAQAGENLSRAIQATEAAEATADLAYLIENAPAAIQSSLDGLGRITTIVRSMKAFAHPDQAEKTLADLNQATNSTLVIAHNEYKYVADLETQFGTIPPVMCHLGEINQVVLNLLINASHAVGDVYKATGQRGKLTVCTRQIDDAVEISITDTGTGIPEGVRDKIFDPFFTTKKVGVGTGQGLAIAHSVVVKKHGGTLRFDTQCGKGTTFYIRLPIKSSPVAEEETPA